MWGGVAKAGNRVPYWLGETCAIAGNTRVVGIIYSRTMEMVTVGGDVAEMQEENGRQRGEEIQIDEDDRIRYARQQ